MKKAFAFLSFAIPIIASAQWVTVRHDSDYMLNEVVFLNEDTGFVAGSQLLSGTDGVVIRTHDGGSTWDTTILSGGLSLTSLAFPNDSVGYTGGQDGAVFKTTNGGTTWNYFGNLPFMFDDFYELYFMNSDTGFAIDNIGYIWRTNDGAISWDSVYSPPDHQSHLGWPNRGNMQFLNDMQGFAAVGANGYVVKTIDGGNTWTNCNIGDTTMNVTAIYMQDVNYGFAIGTNGKLSRTADGGSTWSAPTVIGSPKTDLEDIVFFNNSVGYIVGGNDYYSWPAANPHYGEIYTTTDAGTTWTRCDSVTRDWLTQLWKVNDSVGYCAGWDGRILKIGNAFLYAGENEISTASPAIGFYPNPVETDYISVSGNITGNFQFTLYDASGRTMVSHSGERHEIYIGPLPPGIYCWQIVTDDGTIRTGKLVRS